jgi:hypothetical protein
MTTILLEKYTYAHGRNKGFTAHTLDLSATRTGRVIVEVWSKVIGDGAPIVLSLSADDATRVGAALLVESDRAVVLGLEAAAEEGS